MVTATKRTPRTTKTTQKLFASEITVQTNGTIIPTSGSKASKTNLNSAHNCCKCREAGDDGGDNGNNNNNSKATNFFQRHKNSYSNNNCHCISPAQQLIRIALTFLPPTTTTKIIHSAVAICTLAALICFSALFCRFNFFYTFIRCWRLAVVAFVIIFICAFSNFFYCIFLPYKCHICILI